MAKPVNTPKIVTKKHIARLERERQQVRLIRAIAVGGILIVVLLLAYGYLNLNVFQLQKPVAEVNGEVITTREWQERVRFQRVNLLNLYNTYVFYQQNFGMDTSQQQQEVTFYLQSPETLGQQVIDQMIDEALIRQEAEKRGITVSEEEIQNEIQSEYGFFPNGTPTPTVTPTEFLTPTLSAEQLTIYPPTSTPTEAPTSTVTPTSTPDRSVTQTPTATAAPPTPTFVPELPTATATPFTEEGFKEQYSTTVSDFKSYNVSETTLRSVYRNRLLRAKLLEEIARDVPRTEEQVWARHILVEDERSLGIVRSLLASGWDFADVAKKYSKDTGSGAAGGDLGWAPRSKYVKEFADAAFSQKIGEVGEPVKSEFGYHIIQVIDRQERPLDPTEYEQKREAALTDWLTKTRADATEAGTLVTYDTWKTIVPTEPTALNPKPQ
ncbi:MAG TPA: peptidylprolyl isomerase [Anaerolineales bacterium]|nr:peptidylprolyl isomerase [Anaerolineales bacterium]